MKSYCCSFFCKTTQQRSESHVPAICTGLRMKRKNYILHQRSYPRRRTGQAGTDAGPRTIFSFGRICFSRKKRIYTRWVSGDLLRASCKKNAYELRCSGIIIRQRRKSNAGFKSHAQGSQRHFILSEFFRKVGIHLPLYGYDFRV